ncbi:MAG: Stage III sporulation protein AH [Firmicutes bacterium ADurb.Bin373]|nr:SpoIIIAH-like family protein [Bacillota bacterium]OQA07020.1 MAG: Stage III sporulation protein AH [Firmicutes bacterium ADurb.Bin373]
MFSVIIKRRTLTLILMGICGVLLLLAGLKGGLFEQKNPGQGMPVNRPVNDVSIEEVTPQPFMANKTEEVNTGRVNDSSDFYVEYRLERDRTRGQRIEWLREVINNDKSAVETRQKAQESLLVISSKMEIEIELESLLRAKGFKDAAVMADEQAVTVIVTADKLSVSESSEINNLVSRRTGVDAQHIVIIPKI